MLASDRLTSFHHHETRRIVPLYSLRKTNTGNEVTPSQFSLSGAGVNRILRRSRMAQEAKAAGKAGG